MNHANAGSLTSNDGQPVFAEKRVRGRRTPARLDCFFRVFRGSDSYRDWVAGEARAGSFVVTICQSPLPNTRIVLQHCLKEDVQATALFFAAPLFSSGKQGCCLLFAVLEGHQRLAGG